MKHSKRQKQRQPRQQCGGMKLGESVKAALMSSGNAIAGNAITDNEIIRLLFSNVESIRVVADRSTYSFVLELKLQSFTLMSTFGLSLNESEDVPANDAFGTAVHNLCIKISFVSSRSLIKDYYGVIKGTVSAEKANQEAHTLGELFQIFACRRTTAPFVPDVIAHTILEGDEFRTMFEGLRIIGATDVKRIFYWMNKWIQSDNIRVDVLLMEMLDVERSAPRVQRFQTISSLSDNPHAYLKAQLRMISQIAAVIGIKIVPYDSHLDNGLTTPDGEQGFLIDLGGTFDLRLPTDLNEIRSFFLAMVYQPNDMRLYSLTQNVDEEAREQNLLSNLPPTANHKDRALTRFPSIEDLCGFFQSSFYEFDRDDSVRRLRIKFQENLDRIVNFMCEAPTPENVHHTLMMLGFLDFMINLMRHMHPYCQCRGGLSSVYPSHLFHDFRDFLNTFRVNTLPTMPTRLPDVVDLINEIVAPCPQYCEHRPISVRPNWPERQEAARVEAAARVEEAPRIEEEEALRVEEEAAPRQEAGRKTRRSRKTRSRKTRSRKTRSRKTRSRKTRSRHNNKTQ